MIVRCLIVFFGRRELSLFECALSLSLSLYLSFSLSKFKVTTTNYLEVIDHMIISYSSTYCPRIIWDCPYVQGFYEIEYHWPDIQLNHVCCMIIISVNRWTALFWLFFCPLKYPSKSHWEIRPFCPEINSWAFYDMQQYNFFLANYAISCFYLRLTFIKS